jgi:hypothetical protein
MSFGFTKNGCWVAMQWFTKAGFSDVKIKRIGPKWYRGVRRHGLIMGCSVTGVKPKVGTQCLLYIFVWYPGLAPKRNSPMKGHWGCTEPLYCVSYGQRKGREKERERGGGERGEVGREGGEEGGRGNMRFQTSSCLDQRQTVCCTRGMVWGIYIFSVLLLYVFFGCLWNVHSPVHVSQRERCRAIQHQGVEAFHAQSH